MIARRHASSAEDTESSCTPRPAQSTMSSRSSRHCCSSAATRAPAAGAATTAARRARRQLGVHDVRHRARARDAADSDANGPSAAAEPFSFCARLGRAVNHSARRVRLLQRRRHAPCHLRVRAENHAPPPLRAAEPRDVLEGRLRGASDLRRDARLGVSSNRSRASFSSSARSDSPRAAAAPASSSLKLSRTSRRRARAGTGPPASPAGRPPRTRTRSPRA